MIGIELQMYEETAPFKRTRYYLSGIDMGILEKGKDYDALPAVTMVYITKKDFIGRGSGCYLIERKADSQGDITDIGSETQSTINISNGVKERYYRTETFPRIVERVRYFKVQEKGVDIMCEIADRIRNEGRLEGMVDTILELLEELGQVPQRIVELVTEEENMSVLSRWLKSAARATSIAEFEANM